MSEYEEKYFRINRKIFDLGLYSDELTVLLCLHSHDFNPEHPQEVYPSKDKIRKFAKIGKGKCDDIIQLLHDAGIIFISKRKRSRGRDGNLYHLKKWDTIDIIQVKEMTERLKAAREMMKEQNKIKSAIRLQESDNKRLHKSDNTRLQIGFNTGLQESPNINNSKTINKILITQKETDPKIFKILWKGKIYGKTYAVKSNNLVWCYEDRQDYSISNLITDLPKEHKLYHKIHEFYPEVL